MFRILMMVCVFLVVGCSDEGTAKEESQKEVMKKLGKQQYDHRSLEQRVRESSANKKQQQDQASK